MGFIRIQSEIAGERVRSGNDSQVRAAVPVAVAGQSSTVERSVNHAGTVEAIGEVVLAVDSLAQAGRAEPIHIGGLLYSGKAHGDVGGGAGYPAQKRAHGTDEGAEKRISAV